MSAVASGRATSARRKPRPSPRPSPPCAAAEGRRSGCSLAPKGGRGKALGVATAHREADYTEATEEHEPRCREGDGEGSDEAREIGVGTLEGIEEPGNQIEACGGAGEGIAQRAVGVDREAVG